MQFFDTEILGRTLQQWAIGLGTAIGLWIVLVTLKRVLSHRIAALAARTHNTLDDLIAQIIRRTRPGILLLLSGWPALYILHAGPRVREVAHVITVLILTVQAAIWGRMAIDYFLITRRAEQRKDDATSASTMGGVATIARILFVLILVIIALDNLGVNVSTLIAGLGIGGIAVALALQNVLGDLFASLSIAMDKPFVVGDTIKVGDLSGTVEHVGLKTTRVKSITGEQLVFSNTDLLGSRIHNFKRMWERRILFTIGVTYETPFDKLKQIPEEIEKIVRAESGVRFDRAHFLRYDDFALTFEIVYFVLSPDYAAYVDVQQKINFAIFRRFEEMGIEFAYPTSTLYIRQPAGTPMRQDAPGTA
jgi:small-conductance mechanosensitive channel